MRMEKEELMFLDFLRVFFRRGAEDAFQYIMRREVLSNDQIERLKNVVLKQYQIWYLIDEAREKFNPNINENWALALVSSTLIENVVKQSLLSFGYRPTRSFEENAKRLVELAEKQGIKLDLSELIEAWGGRKIPVHEAYKYPVSAEFAQRSYERALRLINTLSPLFKKRSIPEIFVIDWSEPSAPLTRNRVIVVDNEAYYMGEPYDSWVKEKNIRIERRPSSEDYHKYLESIGIRCTHRQPQSIEWLEEKLRSLKATSPR